MDSSDAAHLTDKELKEEVTRYLTAHNPHAPDNIIQYDFKEKQYKNVPVTEHMAVHYSSEGNLLHIESEEARLQIIREGVTGVREIDIFGAPEEETEEGPGILKTKLTPAEKKYAEEVAKRFSDKKLSNQFNYCERDAQTSNPVLRTRSTETEPPPRAVFAGHATQWIIFDFYAEDFKKQQEKNVKNAPKKVEETASTPKYIGLEAQADELQKASTALNFAERMVNQNTYDDINQDFKYYEDESDEYRDNIGTLLPLWKFIYDKARKLSVTGLCWSPKYRDLFVVGYGSYEFMKQVNGIICFYTMKNPSYPEYTFETEKGILSLDLHPNYPYLLCVGFDDGSVGVFNLIFNMKKPLYLSNASTGKHTDPVWQVKWHVNEYDNNFEFFSISADGRIAQWTLIKEGIGLCHECPNDLAEQDVLKLQNKSETFDGQLSRSCGTSFAFHPTLTNILLVATEEGNIYKCCLAYSSHFLAIWKAHYMAVYKVAWNTFHSDIFISCSADWSVKIWDHRLENPRFVFDLNSPVGDVAWSPYSSTIFAAGTSEGRVYIFDLNVNKYEPICSQVVVKKKRTRITHLSFNPIYPILIVGDDKGNVNTLKLSPNLRKLPKEKKGIEQLKGPELEIQKLEQVLATVA